MYVYICKYIYIYINIYIYIYIYTLSGGAGDRMGSEAFAREADPLISH